MKVPITSTERKEIVSEIEMEYKDYDVDSFDVASKLDHETHTYYILQNIKLIGKHRLSPCGKYDGQPLPEIVAPSRMPMAGWICLIRKPLSYQGENI